MVLWATVGFGLLLILVSLLLRKAANAEEYLIGRRDFGPIQVGSGLFTLIGGGEFATLALLGFLFGWSAIALFVGYSIGFVILGLLSGRLRRNADSLHHISLPDFIHHRFGREAGLSAFIISFAAFFALLMLQFSAVGSLISPLTGLSRELVIFGTAAVIVFYLVRTGFRAVMLTDVIQAFFMIIFAPALLIIAVNYSGVKPDFSTGSEGTLPVLSWISLVASGALIAVASADVWQRAFAAKSDAKATCGFFIGAGVFILVGFVALGFGVLAHSAGLKNPETAFADVLTQHVPATLGWIVALLVMAAMMSTADTEVFLLTTLLKRQHEHLVRGDAITGEIKTLQLLLAAVTLASAVAAFYFDDLIAIYTWLLSMLVTIAPAVIGSLLFEKLMDRKAYWSSVVAGVFVFAIGAFMNLITFDNFYLAAIPAVVILLIMVGLNAWTERNKLGGNIDDQ